MSAPVRRETHRLFPDLMDLLEWPFTTVMPHTPQMIRVEEYIEGDAYIIRAELPGIDPAKDVEITITGDILRIHAERQSEQKEGHRSEFRYGTFTRAIALPRGATAADVKAGYDKGVLTITVPLPEAKREAHRVAVEQPKN